MSDASWNVSAATSQFANRNQICRLSLSLTPRTTASTIAMNASSAAPTMITTASMSMPNATLRTPASNHVSIAPLPG